MKDFNHAKISDLTKEVRRSERRAALRDTWDRFAGFVRDNQDVLLLTIPAAVATTTGVCKVTSKLIGAHTVNKEIRYKERTIYDHSLGRYVELKKPLTAAQALTIEERRAAGEKLHTILDSMNLLKK